MDMCEHLAALQSVLMLSLQLIKGNTETLLLLRWNSGVGLLQQGTSALSNLQKLCLLILELLKLCLQKKNATVQLTLTDEDAEIELRQHK